MLMNQRKNLLLVILILFIGTSHSLNTCEDDNLIFDRRGFNIETIKNVNLSVDNLNFRFCNPIPESCGGCKNGFNGCDEQKCIGISSPGDPIEMIYKNGYVVGLTVTHRGGDDFDQCWPQQNELKIEVFCDENSITNPTNITVRKGECRTTQTIIRMYHKDACQSRVCGQSCREIRDNCITCPDECLSCSFSGFALLQNILGDIDTVGYQLPSPVLGNFLNNTDLPVVSYLMTSFLPDRARTYKFRVRGENADVQVLVNYNSVIDIFEQPKFEVESIPIPFSDKESLLIYVRVKSSSGRLEKRFELDWDIGNGYEPIKGVYYSKHVCGDGLLDITEDPNECDKYGLKVIPISEDLFD